MLYETAQGCGLFISMTIIIMFSQRGYLIYNVTPRMRNLRRQIYLSEIRHRTFLVHQAKYVDRSYRCTPNYNDQKKNWLHRPDKNDYFFVCCYY